ncbi:MAG TPA: hypothetical protein VLK33_16910 [Terriglobales bacterium]|nr:hypothetical protein [Terriglobales bacterium]
MIDRKSSTRLILGVIIASLFTVFAGATSEQIPTIVIRKPTLIAFFVASLKDADTNEALSDFQFYLGEVQVPLNNKGIEVREVYSPYFRIRRGSKTASFRPVKGVGYYFAAPEKEPRVEYGVSTDSDLLKIADEYFRK